jgi:hypothetical protein
MEWTTSRISSSRTLSPYPSTSSEAFICILLIRPRASSQAQEAREQLAGQRSLLQNTLVTLSGMRGTG